MNDLQLFRAIAGGDGAAFETLHDRYREPVCRAALKWCRSVEAAEEIAQEVFASLWVSREKLSAVETPAAYLFTVAYHRIHAHLRVEANRQRILCAAVDDLAAATRCTEETLAARDGQRLLLRGLGELSETKRSIFLLNRHYGYSTAEIGRRLNLSPHTVKSHLQQTRKYLRHFFHRFACWVILAAACWCR